MLQSGQLGANNENPIDIYIYKYNDYTIKYSVFYNLAFAVSITINLFWNMSVSLPGCYEYAVTTANSKWK